MEPNWKKLLVFSLIVLSSIEKGIYMDTIIKCAGFDCPKKKECIRYITMIGFWQKYGDFEEECFSKDYINFIPNEK